MFKMTRVSTTGSYTVTMGFDQRFFYLQSEKKV